MGFKLYSMRLAGATRSLAHVHYCTGMMRIACCCDWRTDANFNGTQTADPNLSEAGVRPCFPHGACTARRHPAATHFAASAYFYSSFSRQCLRCNCVIFMSDSVAIAYCTAPCIVWLLCFSYDAQPVRQ